MRFPFENDTGKVIRRLSNARLRQNRLQNCLVGIMILVSAGILSFVCTYAYNITHQYAASTSYQGIFHNLSPEQASLLSADRRIETAGFYQSVGITDSKDSITMSIVCADAAAMQLSGITLTDGHMPKASDELLVEKGYLDTLAVKAQIGGSLPVTYRNQASRQLETKNFRIAGFIQTAAERQTHRTAFNAVAAPDFVKENPALSAQGVSAMIAVSNESGYTNQQLKELVPRIGQSCNVSSDNIQVNYLYIDSNHASAETVVIVLLIGIILIGICSLVICNIFYLSIISHVKSFGQLRTVGTTKKQIKQIVTRECSFLARCFIPPGCLCGGLLAFLADRSAVLPLPDGMLVLLSGAVIFISVRLSVRKPAQIAMSVSPVEAIRYHSYRNMGRSRRSIRRLTPLSLAYKSLARNRKKSILTFASLALSGMLFVGVSSMLSSLDPVKRAKQSFPYEGAYLMELNRALVTPAYSLTNLQADNPLTEELKHAILSIEGVSGIVCQQEISVSINGIDEIDGIEGIEGMETSVHSMNAQDQKRYSGKVIEGTLPDFDAVGTDTLVINAASQELAYLQKSYEVGDTVTFLQTVNGTQYTLAYQVSAVISAKDDAASFLLPAKEMEQSIPYHTNSAFVIQTNSPFAGTKQPFMEDPDLEASLEPALRALIAGNDTLRLKTLKDTVLQYQSVFSTIRTAAYALLAVVAVFSILNLVNTSITHLVSQKKELGLFCAVGLDSRQLSRMIAYENAFQTAGSFVFSSAFGIVIGKIMCQGVSNVPGFSFVAYTFPFVSVSVYFLAMLLLQIFLTRFACRYCRRSSLAVQLRGMD